MKLKVALAGLIVCASCVPRPNGPSIRFPYLWPGTPGFGGNIDQQGILEPSGICVHPVRSTLFVVSDEGWVHEITKEGAAVSKTRVPGDLEGITVDPLTGLLYIVIEGEDVILEFDPVAKTVTRRFPIRREFRGDPNFLQKQTSSYDNGIESIVFVPDRRHREGGTFFCGNQWDPAMICEVQAPLRTSRAEVAEARIIRVLPAKINDPGGMYYDPRTKLLNVVSDADNIFYEVNLQGHIVRQFAFPGNDQEGLTRDEEGYLYVAQDDGGIIKIKDLRKNP